jgi:hypothetical protein
MSTLGGNYTPTDEALKFVAFVRATGNEENVSPEAHYKIADALFSEEEKDWNVLIECLRGMGKALALTEVVYLEDGSTKTIGDVRVGDSIYGADGKLTKVQAKSEVFIDKGTYEVVLSDGRVVTCSDDHLWNTKQRGNGKDGLTLNEKTSTTKDLYSTQQYKREVGSRNPRGVESKYYLPLATPVAYSKKTLPIDPYTLGVVIGDGSIDKASGYARVISHNDDCTEIFSYLPYTMGRNSTPSRTSAFSGVLGIGKELKRMGLNVNTYSKFIPKAYMHSSVEDRIAVLQGLMDTDGTVDTKYSSSFCTASDKLAEDFYMLCTGLGLRVYMVHKDNDHAGCYIIRIKHRGFNPFRLKRKADKVEFHKCTDYQKIKEIRKVPSVPSQCIVVDNESKLFLTSNHVVTHNSTVMEYVLIYVAALGYWPNFGKVPFMVFLGASQDGNVKALFKNLDSKVKNSEFLSGILTVKRQVDNEIEFENADGVETIIAGRGMNVNWRGIRSKHGQRPQVLVADDVLPNDVMTSETIRNTIETNWYNSALPALDPRRHKIIYIGTPLSEEDLLHKLKDSGVYTVIEFPLCSKFPCAEEDFDSVWPDRFTFKYATNLYKQYESSGRTQSFYTEYMLEITDLTTLLVDEEDVQWFDVSMIEKNKQAYNFYISTDFATSVKKSADYSTMAVWAISSNSDWLLVDGQCKRQTMQDNIDDVFRLVQKWRPLSVGIENSGQQGGFISIMQERMMERNTWFTFAKKRGSSELGIRPLHDKVHRFVTGVQPKFKQNKIWLPKPELTAIRNPGLHELVTEMVNELSKFTLAAGVKALSHDDAIDLLNQLSEMEIYLPSDEVEMMDSVVTEDGIIWTGSIEDEDFSGGSTVF